MKAKHSKHIPNAITRKSLREARRMASQRSLEDIAKGMNQKASIAINPDKRTGIQRRKETTILQTAERLIYGERNKVYKHPTENFGNISGFWNVYLDAIKRRPDNTEFSGVRVNQVDIAVMNILQKIARMATAQDHIDSAIDIAGYAGCIERIVANK